MSLLTPDSDGVARALGTSVFPAFLDAFGTLGGNIAVPANTTTAIFPGQFFTQTGKSPRGLWIQFGIWVVTVQMGATAGTVVLQAVSAACSAEQNIAANGIATLTVLNFGTALDNATLQETVNVRSNQACTVLQKDTLLNSFATYGYQCAVWR